MFSSIIYLITDMTLKTVIEDVPYIFSPDAHTYEEMDSKK